MEVEIERREGYNLDARVRPGIQTPPSLSLDKSSQKYGGNKKKKTKKLLFVRVESFYSLSVSFPPLHKERKKEIYSTCTREASLSSSSLNSLKSTTTNYQKFSEVTKKQNDDDDDDDDCNKRKASRGRVSQG